MSEGVVRRNISFQPDVYAAIEAECEESGLAFSTQLNVMLGDVARARRVLLIGDALNAGLITAGEATQRIAALAGGKGVQQ